MSVDIMMRAHQENRQGKPQGTLVNEVAGREWPGASLGAYPQIIVFEKKQGNTFLILCFYDHLMTFMNKPEIVC